MPSYLKVIWHHDFADEPVVLYSEIDDDGVETRKVEVYRDGRHDYADRTRSMGATVLSEKRMPSIDEIAAQSEFSPSTIDPSEFESVWRRVTEGGQ
jgi:hypothetical protein